MKKDPFYRPSVSVLLAVHNGEQFVRKKLECLLALDYPRELLDILVVSDGSTDATDSIVESFADQGVRLLPVRRGGKPAALNAGLAHLAGEVVFFTDVRQELPPDTLSHLVANFADPTVGVVTGEPRFQNPDQGPGGLGLEFYWNYELWVRRRHSQIRSACNTTGWIYAVRRDLLKPIPPDTLTDDALIPQRVLVGGYRVVVEPRALAFESAKITSREFRRKLRTLAGLWQVHARMPELLTAGNPMLFHFFWHKSARLLLPWAMLMTWLGIALLPASPFQRFLVFAPFLLLAVAALDSLLPRQSILKRVSSPAATFLVMNLAALTSPVVFIVPPAALWPPTQAEPAAASMESVPEALKVRS